MLKGVKVKGRFSSSPACSTYAPLLITPPGTLQPLTPLEGALLHLDGSVAMLKPVPWSATIKAPSPSTQQPSTLMNTGFLPF